MKLAYYILWFILLFSSFEGLGLRSASWGGLGSDGLGWYGILQLLSIGLALIVPFFIKPSVFFDRRNRMGLPSLLLLALVGIVLLQAIAGMFLSGTPDLPEIGSNFVKLKYLLFYFLFVYLLTRPNGIRIAIHSVAAMAVLASVIALFVVLTNRSTDAIGLLISDMVGREFRVILPTSLLVTFGFFYFFSLQTIQRNVLLWGGVLLCFGATLIQMHRSVLIGLTLTTLYAVFNLYGVKLRNIVYLSLAMALVGVGVMLVFNTIGYGIDNLLENITSTYDEITSKSGNFAVRLLLPLNSLEYVLENYLLLGVGLDWQPIEDLDAYMFLDVFYATPTYDSAFNNVIIIFGVLGIAVYLFLIVQQLRTLRSIIAQTSGEIRMLAYTALFMLLYALLTGTSSDTMILQNGAFIFTFTTALVYSINQYLIEANDEDSTSA